MRMDCISTMPGEISTMPGELLMQFVGIKEMDSDLLESPLR